MRFRRICASSFPLSANCSCSRDASRFIFSSNGSSSSSRTAPGRRRKRTSGRSAQGRRACSPPRPCSRAACPRPAKVFARSRGFPGCLTWPYLWLFLTPCSVPTRRFSPLDERPRLEKITRMFTNKEYRIPRPSQTTQRPQRSHLGGPAGSRLSRSPRRTLCLPWASSEVKNPRRIDRPNSSRLPAVAARTLFPLDYVTQHVSLFLHA